MLPTALPDPLAKVYSQIFQIEVYAFRYNSYMITVLAGAATLTYFLIFEVFRYSFSCFSFTSTTTKHYNNLAGIINLMINVSIRR